MTAPGQKKTSTLMALFGQAMISSALYGAALKSAAGRFSAMHRVDEFITVQWPRSA